MTSISDAEKRRDFDEDFHYDDEHFDPDFDGKGGLFTMMQFLNFEINLTAYAFSSSNINFIL